MKTIEEIVKSGWYDGAATEDFARHVRAFLDKTNGEPITTTALFKGLGVTPAFFKPLTARSWNARDLGLLDGYYDKGGKGAFGRAKITWHKLDIAALIAAPLVSSEHAELIQLRREKAEREGNIPLIQNVPREPDPINPDACPHCEDGDPECLDGAHWTPEQLRERIARWQASRAKARAKALDVAQAQQSKENASSEDENWLNET